MDDESAAERTAREWQSGEFSDGIVGAGFGYYETDLLIDGEEWRRWRGVGVNMAFSASPFIWGLANASLSTDLNLGFGNGIEVNGGVGPTLSIGLPIVIRGWGALKMRGNAASSDGEGYAGYGLNPEAGLSVFLVDFRWVFPSVAGGGDTQQGNSFFAGVSLGLP